MRPVANPFIFVLALARSGSTLLAYVLDSHSRIHVVHEDSGRPHRKVAGKEDYNLREKIQNGLADYLNGLLAESNKEHLVTTRYHARRHVRLITDTLGPHVKFIVLTRRHMWRTFQDASGNKRVVPIKHMLEFALCRRTLAPYAHTDVTYDAMVHEPGPTFARLCQFIGVEFEPAMLDYASFEHPIIDHRGNQKAREFARIMDRADAEPHTLPVLIREAVSRIRLSGPKR